MTSITQHSLTLGEYRPEFVRDETLSSILEDTAQRNPEKTALIYGNQSLSYGELNTAANHIAGQLIQAGIGPGQLIGLWLPRGLDLLIMQAGIAKAGAGWLPFDAEVPPERIAVCMEDAHATGLLTSQAFQTQLPALPCPIWYAEALRQAPANSSPLVKAHKDHPAYVIYTSGSTGKAKGIEISQGSICHFLRSENAQLGVCENDRVYQGFSVAFDMSFEEIWISYLVGATLWIAPKEVTNDPDALAQALIEQEITVLHAVPTLLALIPKDVPSLRLINLGGEMCPEALVSKWDKPGRRLTNTYGPTEATVSASLATLRAGEPITIGKPLPNYGLLVVDEHFNLLPQGETGELCITGPGVAVGYLGRPDLTAQKFLDNPWSQADWDKRLYKTGDLARIDEHGQVHCLGRADDQVKIRGFRVELGEIEAVLAKQPGVGTNAVILRTENDIEQLIAFWVPEPGVETPVPAALRQALAQKLPAYMVPGRFEQLDAMPRLTSGKIDRKQLKTLPLAALSVDNLSDQPENEAEKQLFAEIAKLFPGQPLQRTQDFFTDLGGHSLLAARLISALRTNPRFANASVREIYQHRTLGNIAAALEAMQAETATPAEDYTPPPSLRRWLCGGIQIVAVAFFVMLYMAQWLAPFFVYHYFTGGPNDSIALAIVWSALAFVGANLAGFGMAIVGKRLVSPKLKPGRYPLWGGTYLRWWFADRLIECAPLHLLNGSPFYRAYLRALGVKIDKNVFIGQITIRAPELLNIGEGASIGSGVNFENVRIERGQMLVGAITLGKGAYVGSYTVLEGDTHIEDYGHLEGQSALHSGQTIPSCRIWQGSPAREIGIFDPSKQAPPPVVSQAWRFWEKTVSLIGALGISILFFMPVFPTFMLIDWLDSAEAEALRDPSVPEQLTTYFLYALPASAILILLTALLAALIRWGFMPKVKPGRFPLHSARYLNKWLVNQIQETSLAILHGVYATIYAPYWYRLLGAKVGKHAEISTALGVVPDMLTLGDESFIADAVMLGDEEIDGGWVEVQPTIVGKRSFVGNSGYVPDGTVIPDNVLIGVLSRAPANDKMRSGHTWLGSPAMELPARETPIAFAEDLTFHPSLSRRLGRALVEALRIVTPHALVIAVGYTLVLDIIPESGGEKWLKVALQLAGSGLLFGIGSFLFVVLLKWLLIGRYRPCAKPMWTPFVWTSEAITNLYEGIAVPNFLRYLRGTPWLPALLRLTGAKIGKGVYLDTTDITEFDCVTIGDHCELNALCGPQTHLFEDRIMKIDEVQIGNRVIMGVRSIVLYGAKIQDSCRIGALTLVMKGEHLPANTHWVGSPASPQSKRPAPFNAPPKTN